MTANTNDPQDVMALRQGDLRLLNSPVATGLLGSTELARVAYVAPDGTPRVLPMLFHWTGTDVVLATFGGAGQLAPFDPLLLRLGSLLGGVDAAGALDARLVAVADLKALLGCRTLGGTVMTQAMTSCLRSADQRAAAAPGRHPGGLSAC